MSITPVIDLFREAVSVVIRLSAPVLLLSMLVGVVTAIIQAVTQIHEQTISFVLKLTVVVLFLTIGGGWMMQTLVDFTMRLFELMQQG